MDKSVLLGHADKIKGQRLTLSSPFSARRRRVCFERVAEAGSPVIARVRLPGHHPDAAPAVGKEDEAEDVAYAIACEMATMRFVEQELPGVVVPPEYAFEGPGSQLAADAGGVYIEAGFYGNTLRDVGPDMSPFLSRLENT
ncbi:hypothetical protein J3459_014241 [Metarhizium acridum]|nr:hypothetical protein J3459_014241 [Metarhizium acridum]